MQELNDLLSTWVKHLYGLVDKLNDTETQMTGIKAKDVIELIEVLLVESYPPEDTLPKVGLYHYLLKPGKEHNDKCNKATDRIWSKKTYRLSEITFSSGNRVMYYLADGPEGAFIKEELLFIPEDRELPPDFVQK